MPALRFWGRRWSVGGDEFVFPALCSVITRAVWCGALVAILLEVDGQLEGCSDGWYIYTYLVCSIATLALAAAVEWAIASVSTQGDITDTGPRSKLGRYLNLHVLLATMQLLMAGVGTFVLTKFHTVCAGSLDGHTLTVLLGVVVGSQFLDVALTLCCCCTAAGIAPPPDDERDGGLVLVPRYEAFPPEESRRRWASRCRKCCGALSFCTCRMFGGGGDQADFEHLARVMDRIFHTQDHLDVVPSDIAAGIVLLRHVQRARERRLQENLVAQRELNASIVGPDRNVRKSAATAAARSSASAQASATSASATGTRNSDNDAGAEVLEQGRLALQMQQRSRSRSASPSRLAPPPHDPWPGPGPGAACGADGRTPLPPRVVMSRPSGLHWQRQHWTSGGGSAGGSPFPGQSLFSWMSHRSREHLKWHRVATRNVLDINEPNERALLEEVCHFARYALAIYTWYLYIFDKPCCGACELCVLSSGGCSNRFHRRRRRQFAARGGGSEADPEVLVSGDNCCAVHEAALLRVAGLHRHCELVFASFHNDSFETPYAIFVDHQWESVVVAVRGTMSLDDCITDALAEPESMASAGRRWGFDGEHMLAHHGTLHRAEWLREDIEKRGVLRALLAGGDVAAAVAAADSRDPEACEGAAAAAAAMEGGMLSPLARYCRNYRVRVVGHSLGAGVAVLLGYMLRGSSSADGDNGSSRNGGNNGGNGGGNGGGMAEAEAGTGGSASSEGAAEIRAATRSGGSIYSSGRGASSGGGGGNGGGSSGGSGGGGGSSVGGGGGGGSSVGGGGGGGSSVGGGGGGGSASYGAVRCVALSPPGGLLDETHAAECGEWVVAAVLSNDIVPRAGIETLENMRDQVLELIGRAKVNKLTVMRSALGHSEKDPGDLLRQADEAAPQTRYQAQLLNYMRWAERRRQARASEPRLLPPGRLIHFVKTHRTRRWPFGEPHYTPVWAANTEFDEVVISPSMFVDHFPTRSIPAMERTLRDMLQEAAAGAAAAAAADGGSVNGAAAAAAARETSGRRDD